MSKGLNNIPKLERPYVISRRLRTETKGLGWWAAFDAKNKGASVLPEPEAKTLEAKIKLALDKSN